MKTSAYILLFFLQFVCCYGVAQPANKQLNLRDSHGKPDGLWYVYNPASMGEPAMTEFGYYDHGLKTGTWYKSDAEGSLIAIENYKHDVLDGEVKYFEQGFLSCIGHYRGLNPAYKEDTILITDPITGDEKLVTVPTERHTVRHGIWRFYDPASGRLTREEEYQVDNLIFKQEFRLSREDSLYYTRRNALLPHIKGNTGHPVKKTPVKTLTGYK